MQKRIYFYFMSNSNYSTTVSITGPSESPLVDAASRSIEEMLDDPKIRSRGMLPSVKSLSRTLRVSVTTVLRAVDLLRLRGLVTPVRGKGNLINGVDEPGPAEDPSERLRKWQQVKAAILRDFASGSLPVDLPLPSIKELQHRYGACYMAVRTALRALGCELGLKRYKKTYALQVHHERSTNRIAVIMPNLPSEARIEALQGLTYDFLRTLERQAGLANLRIEVVTSEQMRRLGGKGLPFLGYCLWGGGSSGSREQVEELRATGKPVAIIDESDDDTGAFGGSIPKGCKIFLLGASRHGPRLVAAHLAALGHRRIAFIAPWNSYHQTDGSVLKLTRAKRLYEGLREAYAAIDAHAQITPFTFDELGDGQQGASDRANEFRRRYKISRDVPMAKGSILEILNALPPPLVAASRRYIAQLDDLLTASDSDDPHNEIFRSIAQNAGITAWITSYDMYGFLAHRFLDAAGLAVPHRRSLLSFDDLSIALASRFTSYNFNVQAAVTGALDHLLHADARGSLHRENVVHVEGFIMNRGTTGRVYGSIG